MSPDGEPPGPSCVAPQTGSAVFGHGTLDRMTKPSPPRSREGPPHAVWRLYLSECVGTLLLVAVGCSLVVLDFAKGSPVVHALPSAAGRRALTGFLFGATGGSIALSPVGRVSGAHINPIVSLAFWRRGKLAPEIAVGYVAAQLVGAVLGALPLLLWGRWAASVHLAATMPGPAGPWVAVLGEVGATMCLVVGLFVFLGHRRLRRFTPGLFAPLYAFLVWAEAPLSGTSTNPARSLGPALVGHTWTAWWVDWIGPLAGLVLGLAILQLPRLALLEEEVAKLYHFHWDPHGILHGTRPSASRSLPG